MTGHDRRTSSDLPRPYEIRATPGWGPIAIPGRPGWWRHHIKSQQVDLPHRGPQSNEFGKENTAQ